MEMMVAKRCPSGLYMDTNKPLRTQKVMDAKIRKDEDINKVLGPTIGTLSPRITNCLEDIKFFWIQICPMVHRQSNSLAVLLQLIYYCDSEMHKALTGNLKHCVNFVEKFLGSTLFALVKLVKQKMFSFKTKAVTSSKGSSDLAPQRQEMSVENVSSGLVPQGRKDRFVTTRVGISLQSFIEEYYNPTHGLAEENNNDQAPNASFKKMTYHPFLHGLKKFSLGTSRQTIWQDDYKAKVVMEEGIDFAVFHLLPVARLEASSLFLLPTQHTSLFQSIRWTWKTAFLNGHTKRRRLRCSAEKGFVDPIIQKKSIILRKALLWIKGKAPRKRVPDMNYQTS
ncbi:hypothetical protein Tco_0003686 [Tanacetum coccineum]